MVETEQQGSDLVAILVDPEAADHAIDAAPVLDLDHLPFAFRVGGGPPLGHDPVAPGRLEVAEPPLCRCPVAGRGSEAPRLGEVEALETAATLLEWSAAQIVASVGEDIEGHQPGRGCLGEHLDPGSGRMEPALKSIEVETILGDHHHLAVEDRASGEPGQRLGEFREVALQRLVIAAVEPGLVAPCHDSEPIPLGFIGPLVALGDDLTHPGLHGCDRRGEGPGHVARVDATEAPERPTSRREELHSRTTESHRQPF